MANLQSRGMMSVAQTASESPQTANDLKIRITGNPHGRFVITNETTGATKTYNPADLSDGEVIWDWSVDDASAAANDLLTYEYFGTTGGGLFQIRMYSAFSGGYVGQWTYSGQGTGKISGDVVTA